MVLSHVPTVNYDFRPKSIYIAHIMRRVLLTSMEKEDFDDKVRTCAGWLSVDCSMCGFRTTVPLCLMQLIFSFCFCLLLRLLLQKDYYGNKRLELAGQLLALLFEDVLKKFNNDLQRSADMTLQKPNHAQAFDIIKNIRQVQIHAVFWQRASER
jgi:DNA-directed RNA polymerase III subunit RPC2